MKSHVCEAIPSILRRFVEAMLTLKLHNVEKFEAMSTEALQQQPGQELMDRFGVLEQRFIEFLDLRKELTAACKIGADEEVVCVASPQVQLVVANTLRCSYAITCEVVLMIFTPNMVHACEFLKRDAEARCKCLLITGL